MEVTAKNFNECELDKCFEECSFIAIDGEFTGLRSGREYQLNIFDTAEERYRKHSTGSDGMFLVQVGISFFKHLFLNEYSVSTFNFLISPRNPHFCVKDRYFTCQTSSLDLLFKSNFSFDRCFKEGVTYISQHEQNEVKRSLEQRAARRSNNGAKNGNGENANDDAAKPMMANNKAPWWQAFETTICQKLDEFLLNGTPSMGLSDFTEEERNVLLRTIEKKYADKFVLLSDSVRLMKDPSADWLKFHVEDLEHCSGFSSVVKRLSSSKKPLIGHNLYLDLIHIYRQFIGPLSENYEEAKSALHDAFPKVIDTKLLASIEPLKDWCNSTALPELFKSVQKAPFKQPKLQNSSYGRDSGDHLHEAGYDSYITGVVFIALTDKLCALKDEKPGTLGLESASLQPYFNKVFMFRSWDYNFISLDRKDTSPNRKNVFHVTFPAAYRTEHILDIFKSFGKASIGWIDDASAWVGLSDADQATFAVKKLCSPGANLPVGVTVRPWGSAFMNKRKSTTEVDDMIVATCQEDDEGDSASNKKVKKMSVDASANGKFEVPDQW